jgi:ATP-dependent Lon protease
VSDENQPAVPAGALGPGDNDIPAELAVLPIFNTVIYPLTVTPLAVGQERSIHLIDDLDAKLPVICVVALRSDRQRPALVTPQDCFQIGTAARVHRLLRLPDGTLRIALEGLERVVLHDIVATAPYYRAAVRVLRDGPPSGETQRLAGELAREARALLDLLPGSNEELRAMLDAETDPRRLGYVLAASLLYRGGVAERQALLALESVDARLQRLRTLIAAEHDALRRAAQASSQAADMAAPPQAGMPEPQADQQPAELASDDGPKLSEHRLLEGAIYGQTAAKQQVAEYLAAAELRRQRSPTLVNQMPILCFVGPAGTGKTTMAYAIAQELGRPLARVSLHAIAGQAALLGQAGGAPGALTRALQQSGPDCVLLLDDLHARSVMQDDVAAALCEITDVHADAIYDRATDTYWDRDAILFVAAARSLDDIPMPLRERLLVVPLAPYDQAAKRAILEGYLMPDQCARHALNADELIFDDEAVAALLDLSSGEPGVTRLEQGVAAMCRYAAARLGAHGQAGASFLPIDGQTARTVLARLES